MAAGAQLLDDQTMNDRDLDALSPRERVAVAAASAQHVIDVYKYGDFEIKVRHMPGMKGDPDADLVLRALDTAWTFVETGVLDEGKRTEALAGVSKEPPGVDSENLGLAGITLLDAIASTLNAVTDPSPRSASQSVSRCRAALMSAIECIDDGIEESERMSKVEASWQDEVLERVKISNGKPSRALFAELLSRPKPWQHHIDAYRDYNGA
jgi:hypothetical protein